MNIASSKILVVDDQPANVILLEDLLDEEGFENIECITDSRLVEAAVKASRPDIILLDIRMPHIDGFGVLGILNKIFPNNMPMVMVLTAENDPSVRSKALANGAIDFLNKPFDNDEVVLRVKNLLDFNARHNLNVHKNEELSTILNDSPEDIAKLSLLDPVSGLPNRRALSKDIINRFSQRYMVASMIINIDGMEFTEHVHGHVVAEKLFRLVAAKCADVVNVQDMTWGCWGGYQLVLLTSTISELQLKHFAREVMKVIRSPHYLDTLILYLNGRIGICLGEDIYNQGNELIRRAQLATPPRGDDKDIRMYNGELEREILRSNAIRGALPGAILKNEFSLFYQPKVSLADNSIKGVEALIRWNSSHFGFVPPDEFIGIAEASGRIEALGEWVIRQALSDIKAMRAHARNDDFTVAINVSASQLLNPEFADNVIDMLKEYNVSTSAIELEVTESLMIHDLQNVVVQLNQLRCEGIKIALDDFGTGYSSLSYLRKLPIDILKIDRAFVTDIVHDIDAKSLVKGIINLAKVFDFSIVAEGIEDKQQESALAKLGCHIGQGYLYAKPMPLVDLLAKLKERKTVLSHGTDSEDRPRLYR